MGRLTATFLTILLIALAATACGTDTAPRPAPAVTTLTASEPATQPAPGAAPARAPANLPTGAPAPTSAPGPATDPTATMNPPTEPRPTMKEDTAGGDTALGMIQPIQTFGTINFRNTLSQQELTCLPRDGAVRELIKNPHDRLRSTTPQEARQFADCLSDETALRLLVSQGTQQPGPLSENTSSCIRSAFRHLDTRGIIALDTQAPMDTGVALQALAAYTIMGHCMTQHEWDHANTALQQGPEARDFLCCVVQDMGSPTTMAQLARWNEENFSTAYREAADTCSPNLAPDQR